MMRITATILGKEESISKLTEMVHSMMRISFTMFHSPIRVKAHIISFELPHGQYAIRLNFIEDGELN